MKRRDDPRHKTRQKIVKELFAQSFTKQAKKSKITQKILKQESKIDEIIRLAAPAWPIQKIAKIDLAILRLAAYELLVYKQEPPKVIIDEAVELAKELGSENSPSFVNGVLGTILKTIKNAK